MPCTLKVILLKRCLRVIRGENLSPSTTEEKSGGGGHTNDKDDNDNDNDNDNKEKVDGGGSGKRAQCLKEISEILEGRLYLSGCRVATSENLAALGITAVVRAMTEDEEAAAMMNTRGAIRIDPDHIRRRMVVRVADTDTADIRSHFDSVSEFIDKTIEEGGKVLVHCGAGVSRSSTLVMAYLIKHQGLNLRRAYELVRAKRGIVRPNNGFFRQLIQYERSASGDGRASVRMVTAPSGYPVPDVVFERVIMQKLASAL